jgi:hypothetical protein
MDKPKKPSISDLKARQSKDLQQKLVTVDEQAFLSFTLLDFNWASRIPNDSFNKEFVLDKLRNEIETWENLEPETVKKREEKERRIEEYNNALRDIERYFGIQELGSVVKPDKSIDNHDSFITSLRISTQNDSEVNFQLPGKEPVPCHYKRLGFKKKGTVWKEFMSILENDGIYNLGPSSDKEYERKRKCVRIINEKLIDFLKGAYLPDLSSDFKLYERAKAERSGTYRFRFQVPAKHSVNDTMEKKHSGLTKEKVLEFLRNKASDYIELSKISGVERTLTLEEEKLINQISDYSSLALQKKWATDKELKEILS